MTKCSEPNCSVKTDTLIKCSSPFCARQFHLTCANLRGKKKSELDNIYFLCNACNEFVQFSNSSVNNKLASLEDKLVLLLNPIEAQLKDLKQQIHKLNSRISFLEEKDLGQENKQLEITNKISELESEIDTNLTKMKQRMDEISKTFQTFTLTSETKKSSEGEACDKNPTANIPGLKNNDTLVKYRVRVSGIPEAPSSIRSQERQKFELEAVNDVFKFIGMSATITDCFRLGKYKEDASKPRSFVVTFSSVWDRNRAIRDARALKNYKTPVFISPELTSVEKVKQQKLLKERWALRS